MSLAVVTDHRPEIERAPSERVRRLVAAQKSLWRQMDQGLQGYTGLDDGRFSPRFPDSYPAEAGPMVRLACDLKAFFEQAPVCIDPDELIVGDGTGINLYHHRWLPGPERLSPYEPTTLDYGAIAGRRLGHTMVDPEYGLKHGIAGIREKYRQRLDEAAAGGESDRVIDYLSASLIVCDAFVGLARRYADEARRQASACPDPQRRTELEEIAATCERVPERPPESFREAVQWLRFLVLGEGITTNGNLHARPDQYLCPYYRADVKAGRFSREEAVELIQCFLLKLDPGLCIGGMDAAGNDATNELSWLFLEAMDGLDFPINIAVRYHGNIDRDFLRYACEVLKRRGDSPYFHSDEPTVANLVRAGFSAEEARNYAVGRCAWAVVPGKEYPEHDQISLCLPKVLERAIRQAGPEGYDSFEALWDAFAAALSEGLDVLKDLTDAYDALSPELYPELLSSLFMPRCVEVGRDMSDNGVESSAVAILGTGLANVADSLAAIRKLVFEEEKVSWAQLFQALQANFEGHDELRRKLLDAPKFGNDDEADSLAVRVAELFCDEVERRENAKGFHYRPGLYSWKRHVELGAMVGALPDGRLAGTPIAQNINPMSGTTRSPTAAILSVTKIDFRRIAAATVNFQFQPSMFRGDEGTDKLMALIETYFDLGGPEFMCNLIDRKVLEDAYAHPEEYPDLMVRVTGFSDFFVKQGREIQREIIARTHYGS